MAKTPTMSDVALLAGVSVGTVSHVLRGSAHVSDALTKRVHEAAETLRYRVDPSAQALRMGYQNIVGIGLFGTRKEVEQAACTFLLPFARELGRSGMEALVLSTTPSSAKHLCLEDCTDIVMRAKRSHLHSLLICLSAESSSCTFIDADAHATGTHADEHRLFPIGQSTSATRDLPIFEVHLNSHGPQRLHGERKTASLEWRPLHVGGNSAEGHSLTRGNITECIEAVMDSRDTTRMVG